MSSDSAESESKITADPDQIETWARETNTVPVREDNRLKMVHEGAFDEARQVRVPWDDFETVIEESNRVVVYREDRERNQVLVRHRDDVLQHLEGRDVAERLRSGDVITGTTTEVAASGRYKPENDDEGKPVVDARGEEVGIVSDVEDGLAYVDPHPSLTETVMAKLGWGDPDEEDYVLDPDQIERITDDRVELVGTE